MPEHGSKRPPDQAGQGLNRVYLSGCSEGGHRVGKRKEPDSIV